MDKLIFSIIMPVYNAQKTVSKAIDSVISQSFDKWELIIINDGSTDETEHILNYYKNKDKRIKIVTQTNMGVANARNKAIELAQGEYLLFIDSDDIFLLNAFKAINQTIKAEKTDVVIAHYCVYDLQLKKYVAFKDYNYNRQKFNTNAATLKHLKDKNISPNIFRYAVKRNLIFDNNIRFDEELVMAEDSLFTAQILCNAKSFSYLNKVIYQYNNNNISLSKNKEIKSILNCCTKLYKFALNQPKYKRKSIYNFILLNLIFLMQDYNKLKKEDKLYINTFFDNNKNLLLKATHSNRSVLSFSKIFGIKNGLMIASGIVKIRVNFKKIVGGKFEKIF